MNTTSLKRFWQQKFTFLFLVFKGTSGAKCTFIENGSKSSPILDAR